MRLTRNTVLVRILLFIGLAVMLNLLAVQFFFRLDFTADQRYTLSESTHSILEDLNKEVTITAYFSDDLPPQIETAKNDFNDLLEEYNSASDGRVVYNFEAPDIEDEVQKNQLRSKGIQAIPIEIRQNDERTTQLRYASALIRVGDQFEAIPQIASMGGIEYALSALIRKLTVTNKPKVGILQGHGEQALAELELLQAQMSISYDVDTFSLSRPDAWSQFRTILILGPKQPLSEPELAQLDAFLASGGNLFVAVDAVDGTLTAQAPWSALNTGLDTWLRNKGVNLEPSFLTVKSKLSVRVPEPQPQIRNVFGMQMQVQAYQNVPFPFFFPVSPEGDHPSLTGLEQMFFKFASPLTLNTDSTVNSGILIRTPESTGKIPAPAYFNPFQTYNYLEPNLAVAAWLEGKISGEADARMVVITDGDLLRSDPALQIQPFPANYFFVANSVDWLTDDLGLIELRNKNVSIPLIDKELEDGERTTLKLLNVLLPILIILGYAMWRGYRRRIQRIEWIESDYS